MTGKSAPNDPLLLLEPLEHRVQLPVLGIAVRFATNDREILGRIEETFGHWRDAGVVDAAAPGADMRIILHDRDEGPGEPVVTYRAPDPMRWILHTPGSFGLADCERQVGVAYVTRDLLRDRARFRVAVLQFLVLITITVKDRTPIHASMIGRGDSALLLAGPTGSGKSTLAYAASKAGMHVFSDDAAYVQLEPKRVWGSGPGLLLLADVAERFPELAGVSTTLFPTGKHKLLAPTDTTRAKPWASRAKVCMVARSNGPVQVTRADANEIVALLSYDPAGAGGRFRDRLEQSARWLAADGGWKLSLSTDANEAIPHIERMLKDI